MTKDLQYYMGLPYRVVLHPADEGGYVVEIPELTGCLSQAETLEDALIMLEDAKITWLETALEDGIEILEPAKSSGDYSGKLNIRIPKSLHRTLAERARDEKVILNQYILYHLARGAGHPVK